MKTKIFIVPLLGLPFMISCSNNEDEDSFENEGFSDMTANIVDSDEEESGLKSYFSPIQDADGNVTTYVCNWSVNDSYAFSDSLNSIEFSNAGKSSINSFSYVKKATDVLPNTSKGTRYWAFYPKNYIEEYKGEGVYSINLPTQQTYVKDSLASKCYPMMAATTNTTGTGSGMNIAFYNLASTMYIKVKTKPNTLLTNKVMSITLEADKPLSGLGSASMVMGSKPSLVMDGNASKTVTLDCGKEGVEVNSDGYTTFAIVVPAGTYNTFKATVNCKNELDNSGTKSFTKSWTNYTLYRSGYNTYRKTALSGYVILGESENSSSDQPDVID